MHILSRRETDCPSRQKAKFFILNSRKYQGWTLDDHPFFHNIGKRVIERNIRKGKYEHIHIKREDYV